MLYHVFQVKDEAEVAKSVEVFQQRHGCLPVAVWVKSDQSVGTSPSPSIPVCVDARMAAGYVYLEVPGQRHPSDGQLALPLVNVR